MPVPQFATGAVFDWCAAAVGRYRFGLVAANADHVGIGPADSAHRDIIGSYQPQPIAAHMLIQHARASKRTSQTSYPQLARQQLPIRFVICDYFSIDSFRQEQLVRGLVPLGRDRPVLCTCTPTSENRSTANPATDLEPLSSKFAYDAQAYRTLPLHEQRWIRAVATGNSMRKAALAGRSAARIHGMWVIGPPGRQEEPVEVMAVGGKPPSTSQWPAGCLYIRQRPRTASIVNFTTLRATDPLSAAFEIALRHGLREGLVAMDWILSPTTHPAMW